MRAVKMKNKKILFISLGCDKNLVDSEVMLGILADRGFEMTDTEDDADIIIINTCCFINDAKEESINTILEMAEYKKTGPCKALIVTGCLAQRYKQEIVDEIPEVDAVIGTSKYDEIFDAVDQALKGSHFLDVDDLDRLPSVPGKRILTTGGHYAHLKIAEGCDKHCTYCIISKIRGNYRSVPMEQLLAEAASLAEQGVKRADSGCPGDDTVRRGSLRQKVFAYSAQGTCQDQRYPLDPHPVLLSGRDISGADRDNQE